MRILFILSALFGICIVVMKHHDQDNLERTGLFGLQIHISVPDQRKSEDEPKQGRKLEAGIDAEPIKECCLLAWSPSLAQPAFL